KIRGFRIEPGEIESALRSLPLVRDAVVMADPNRADALIAFVTKSDQPLETSRLRTALMETLPAYMVPAEITLVDAFPTTRSGKVDRRVLGAMKVERERSKPIEAPRTENEKRVGEIWRQLFHMPTVSVDDSFMELGGHSLIAVQVCTRLRAATGCNIPLRAVFEHPVLSDFASWLDSHTEELHAADPMLPIRRDEKILLGPLSYAQERLWFLDLLEPDNPFYTTPFAIRLAGPLDSVALRQSLELLVQRHDTLRTVYGEDRGVPFQRVTDVTSIELTIENFGELTPQEQEEAVSQISHQESETPFDLHSGPVIRCRLLALGSESHVLVLTIHHIAIDGWSSGVLLGDLAALYQSVLNQRAADLPPLAVRYLDYAIWQREQSAEQTFEEHLDYWREQLRDLSPLDLPTDRPRPLIQRYRGGRVSETLPSDLVLDLNKLARDHHTTGFAALVTCVCSVLSIYSGQRDISIGTSVAGRTRPEIETLVGFFVNAVVLRLDCSAGDSFVSRLSRAKEVVLSAFLHQETPFENVVAALNPERETNYNPLVKVFLVQQAFPTHNRVGELEVRGELLPVSVGTSKFDLTLFATPQQDGSLKLEAEYNEALFDRSTINTLLLHIHRFAKQATEKSTRLLEKVELLSPEESALILFHCTSRNHVRPDVVHAVFERQAVQTPSRVAIEDRQQTWTYAELNAWSDCIARRLRPHVSKAGQIVFVTSERKSSTVAAILGILKAGAAYLPCDPKTPVERMKSLVDLTCPVAAVGLRDYFAKVTRETIAIDIPSFDSLADEVKQSDERSNAAVQSSPRDTAYVLCTSGSSGVPKAVAVSHAAATNYLNWADTQYRSDDHVSALLHTPLTFDLTVTCLFLPLLSGGTLRIAPSDLELDQLSSELAKNPANSIVKVTPSHLKLLGALKSDGFLGSPSVIVVGGEELPLDVVRMTLSGHPGAIIVNEYGPTEATVGCTTWECSCVTDLNDLRRVPIGQARGGAAVYCLRPTMLPCPLRVAGELYLGGPGVARGYVGAPRETAALFVPDPFSGIPGSRLYRSGDLGRLLPNQQLEFLGRVDQQQKIRGFRIEPGEIEGLLNSHPAVSESTVMASPEGDALHGYWVPSESALERENPEDTHGIVERWTDVFQRSYSTGSQYLTGEEASGRDEFDIVGWISSYSGEAYSYETMREWAVDTAKSIREFCPCNEILEIGCGTGILLSQLAPKSRRFVGTDLSENVLQTLRQRITPKNWSVKIELHHLAANEIQFEADFDTVILNSVVQYFPSKQYLDDVIEKVIDCISPGGTLFIGDVRNLATDLLFHMEVVSAKRKTLSRDQIYQQALLRQSHDGELVLHPGYFLEWVRRHPRVTGARISPKVLSCESEMASYRFDVAIQLDDHSERDEYNFNSCGADFRIDDFRELIRNVDRRPVALQGVHHARLSAANRLRDRGGWAGICPVELKQVCEESDFKLMLSWASASSVGAYDLLAVPKEITAPWIPFPVTAAPALTHKPPFLGMQLAKWHPTLIDYLRAHLPKYSVPQRFMALQEMPVTINGKLARSRLPSLGTPGSAGNSSHQFVKPQTETEVVVATVWSNLLDRQVGRTDDFFVLGGHSLLAAQVAARLRESLGVEVPLRELFNRPKLKDFSLWLEEQLDGAESRSRHLQITRTTTGAGPFPLSFAQERLWFLDQLGDDSHAYNVPLAIRLRGDLSVSQLAMAIGKIVERHPVLRTTFRQSSGIPYQMIEPLADCPLGVEDLSDIDKEDREREAQKIIQQESNTVFDLQTGPVFRARVIKLGEAEHLLVMTIHHIAIDGWSIGILLSELAGYYQQAADHDTSVRPDLPIRYVDYAVWQRNELAGENLGIHLRYWRNHLKESRRTTLIPDKLEHFADQVGYHGGRLRRRIHVPLIERIDGIAAECQTTRFCVLATAFSLVVSQYTDDDDITFGTSVAGRNQPQLESLIGFFVNAIVMRLQVDGDQSFRQHMMRSRQVLLDALEHQDAPFERVVAELNPTREKVSNPLVGMFLVYQSFPKPKISGLTLETELMPVPIDTSKFDLTLFVNELDEHGLEFEAEYNTKLYEPDTIANFLSLLMEIVDAATGAPNLPIGQLRKLTEGDSEFWSPQEFEVCSDSHQKNSRDVSSTCVSFSSAQLGKEIKRCAALMQAQGLGSHATVLLWMPAQIERLIALAAVKTLGHQVRIIDSNQTALEIAAQNPDVDLILTMPYRSGCLEQLSAPHCYYAFAANSELEIEAKNSPQQTILRSLKIIYQLWDGSPHGTVGQTAIFDGKDFQQIELRARRIDNRRIQFLPSRFQLRSIDDYLGYLAERAQQFDSVVEAIALRETSDNRVHVFVKLETTHAVTDDFEAMLIPPDNPFSSSYAEVHFVQQWPIADAGRLDRHSLLTSLAISEKAAVYVETKTETESQLSELWSQVLAVDSVSSSSDFFELGGHSLLAAQVVARLRTHTDKDIPLRAVFEHPVLSDFASWLDSHTEE
ncbi:MAG: amino acid adenylation domain-containing protein, partial [Planctomycetales bacterium]|nr:amino acid adenylation domain-containing protein [Planctomycetales bacterium]